MPSNRRITLAGHVVSLTADTDEGCRLLEQFFGNSARSRGRADLNITIGTALRHPPTLHVEAVRQGPTRRWVTDSVLLVQHDLGAVAQVTDSALDITCSDPVGDPWRAIRHLLFSGLSWWLERHDLVLLHGAMIARGSDAALILGDTGQGKSTASYAALRSGWKLCSDDLVVIAAEEGDPRGFGVPKRPSIEKVIAASLGETFDPLEGDDRMRVMLDADELVTGWRRLRMLVVVGHHDEGGVLNPLRHVDSVDAVLAACLEGERPAAVARQLKTLMSVAGLPTFELLHASDVTVRLRRASDMIDQAWDIAKGGAHDQ